MEDDASSASFYYVPEGGGHAGPCTPAQLQVLWQSGHISRETCVWREGMSSWVKVHELPELSPLLSVSQPPAVTRPSWFYLDAGGKRRGGVSVEQMAVLLERGDVDGLTQVWKSGMSAWADLGTVDELRSQLVQAEGDRDGDDDHAPAGLTEEIAYDPDAEAVSPKDPGRNGATRSNMPSEEQKCRDSSSHPSNADMIDDTGKQSKKKKKKKAKFKAHGGSNVYVSGLPEGLEPSELTKELVDCFKIAGVIKTDPSTGAERVKIYTTDGGRSKGDALVGFLKSESVNLAVTLRDGYELRPGVVLKVQPAHFEMRGDTLVQNNGSSSKVSHARKRQRLAEQRQLAEWDDSLVSGGGSAAHVVILLGLFTEAEVADADEHFYANLKEDLLVECSKAGAVEKVTIFEGSEKGAAAVKFRKPDDAERCVVMMRERSFGNEALTCELYDGVSDYRPKTPRKAAGLSDANGEESIEEQESKLESFAQWLEADSTDEELDTDGGD